MNFQPINIPPDQRPPNRRARYCRMPGMMDSFTRYSKKISLALRLVRFYGCAVRRRCSVIGGHGRTVDGIEVRKAALTASKMATSWKRNSISV